MATRILTLTEIMSMTESKREFLSAHAAGKPITTRDVHVSNVAGWSCGYDYRDRYGILRHDVDGTYPNDGDYLITDRTDGRTWITQLPRNYIASPARYFVSPVEVISVTAHGYTYRAGAGATVTVRKPAEWTEYVCTGCQARYSALPYDVTSPHKCP